MLYTLYESSTTARTILTTLIGNYPRIISVKFGKNLKRGFKEDVLLIMLTHAGQRPVTQAHHDY